MCGIVDYIGKRHDPRIGLEALKGLAKDMIQPEAPGLICKRKKFLF